MSGFISKKSVFLLFMSSFVISGSALAETATYGAVDLTGLAKNSWNLNPPGLSNTMVCNVSGPDGYLTIRSKPSADGSSVRKLKRLSVVVVDTNQQRGDWVRVTDAYRTHTTAGQLQALKELPVSGWAHTNYLCDFLD